MEKPSEQKKEELVVMCTKTVEELVSKPSPDAIKCPKCHSPLSDPVYIPDHDVFHCVCYCGYEWIE
jgi:hypothetical protein